MSPSVMVILCGTRERPKGNCRGQDSGLRVIFQQSLREEFLCHWSLGQGPSGASGPDFHSCSQKTFIYSDDTPRSKAQPRVLKDTRKWSAHTQTVQYFVLVWQCVLEC